MYRRLIRPCDQRHVLPRLANWSLDALLHQNLSIRRGGDGALAFDGISSYSRFVP